MHQDHVALMTLTLRPIGNVPIMEGMRRPARHGRRDDPGGGGTEYSWVALGRVAKHRPRALNNNA